MIDRKARSQGERKEPNMIRKIWEFITCRKCWTGEHANTPIHSITEARW